MNVDFALSDDDIQRLAAAIVKLLPAPQPAQPEQDTWLTTKEAAAYLNCSLQRLEIWRSRGGGPVFVKRGRIIRYSRDELNRWLHKGDTA